MENNKVNILGKERKPIRIITRDIVKYKMKNESRLKTMIENKITCEYHYIVGSQAYVVYEFINGSKSEVIKVY